jgi:hypothetical protein
MKGGNYAAIVEHESQETFLAMHNSPAHDEASKLLGPLFDGKPSPQFFEVIIGWGTPNGGRTGKKLRIKNYKGFFCFQDNVLAVVNIVIRCDDL